MEINASEHAVSVEPVVISGIHVPGVFVDVIWVGAVADVLSTVKLWRDGARILTGSEWPFFANRGIVACEIGM